MKKIIYIISCIVLFSNCSTEDSNTAPTAPELVFPINNQTCTDLELQLQWKHSSDADGDSVSYILEVGTDTSFEDPMISIEVVEPFKTISVTKGISYYWRVTAIDALGVMGENSDVFVFHSEGIGNENHAPFAANLTSPSQTEMIDAGTIRLMWNAVDIDQNDILKYHVYLGESPNELTNKAKDITNTYLDVMMLSGKTYYVRVDTEDDKGALTIGQIWRIMIN